MKVELAMLAMGGLLLGAAPGLAQEDGQQTTSSSGTQAAQTGQSGSATAQDKIDLTTWAYAPLYDGWRATRLIDAEVISSEGEEMGEITTSSSDPKAPPKR